VNNVSFRILLVAMMMMMIMMTTWILKAKVVGIETAFLYGDSKKVIYMKITKWMKAEKDECLVLNKIIYGLVQSAREFYEKLVSALQECGFKVCSVDPC
jgi:hypothetical protein